MIRVNSSNGELHYIAEEFTDLDVSKSRRGVLEAYAKEVTKKDASKLLYLAREE